MDAEILTQCPEMSCWDLLPAEIQVHVLSFLYKRTGKVPESAFDKRKLGYLMNRFKLSMKDSDTGQIIDTSVNEDGVADQKFAPPSQDAPEPSHAPPQESTKSKRKKEKREARRQRVLQKQKKNK